MFWEGGSIHKEEEAQEEGEEKEAEAIANVIWSDQEADDIYAKDPWQPGRLLNCAIYHSEKELGWNTIDEMPSIVF